jgi:hypothetical protein
MPELPRREHPPVDGPEPARAPAGDGTVYGQRPREGTVYGGRPREGTVYGGGPGAAGRREGTVYGRHDGDGRSGGAATGGATTGGPAGRRRREAAKAERRRPQPHQTTRRERVRREDPTRYRRRHDPPRERRRHDPPREGRRDAPPRERRDGEPRPYRRRQEPPAGRRRQEPPAGRRRQEPPVGRRRQEPPVGRRRQEPSAQGLRELAGRAPAWARRRSFQAAVAAVLALVGIPAGLVLSDLARDPAYRSLDALRLPTWAAADPSDTATGSRFCIERCRVRKRTWSASRDPDVVVAAYRSALRGDGWRPQRYDGCPPTGVDGDYTCWVRDEYALDLWVRTNYGEVPDESVPVVVTVVVRERATVTS